MICPNFQVVVEADRLEAEVEEHYQEVAEAQSSKGVVEDCQRIVEAEHSNPHRSVQVELQEVHQEHRRVREEHPCSVQHIHHSRAQYTLRSHCSEMQDRLEQPKGVQNRRQEHCNHLDLHSSYHHRHRVWPTVQHRPRHRHRSHACHTRHPCHEFAMEQLHP